MDFGDVSGGHRSCVLERFPLHLADAHGRLIRLRGVLESRWPCSRASLDPVRPPMQHRCRREGRKPRDEREGSQALHYLAKRGTSYGYHHYGYSGGLPIDGG
jgi:hypothetical protein